MNLGNGINLTDPTVVHQFYQAISSQIYWVMLLAAVGAIVIVIMRVRGWGGSVTEHRSRTYLRWGFGIIWLIDGVLQHQAAMPLGLGNQVIAPSAAGTPFWLHDVMESAINLYNRFPITLAAAIMWIQIGIGLLLLCSRGRWSRLAALLTLVWALFVWIVGNGMGDLFSPGASLLFGWPGASLIYVVAAAWLVAPPRVFPTTFSKVTLRMIAVYLGLAVIVQVWPDHQFWHGGALNAVFDNAQTMSQSAQPSWLARVVLDVGRVGSGIGSGVNLIVIYWLVACAFGLWRASTRDLRWPTRLMITGCVVVWVTIQDAAIFGGLATDLNSMIPLSVLVWCAAPSRRRVTAADEASSAEPRWRLAIPASSRRSFTIIGAAAGLAMVLVAIVPMVRSPFVAGAETTQYIADDGGVLATNAAAPAFRLTDQSGRPFSFPLANGKFAIVTFLDPVCWTQCPLLAHQLEDLDQLLTPSERARVQLIAVAANPDHETLADVRSFIATNDLAPLTNFTFVTGPLSPMQRVWKQYDIGVSNQPGQVMSVHSDQMDIVSPDGRVRTIVPDVPGVGEASEVSTAAQLRDSLVALGFPD